MKFDKAQLITGGLGLASSIANQLFGDSPGDQQIHHLWKFVDYQSKFFPTNDPGSRKFGFGAAPDIASIHNPGAATGQRGENIVDHIDVVNNFAWTQSPKSSRDDVPVLFLTEKKIQTNPQLNQIANNMFVLGEKVQRGTAGNVINNADEIKSMISSSKAAIIRAGDAATSFLTTSESASAVGASLQQKITTGANETESLINEQLDKLSDIPDGNVLTPYEQLYYTKNTGFMYSIPYLEQQGKQVQNQFGDGGGQPGVLLGAAKELTAAGVDIAKGLNIADPGTYIEQPELYNFQGRQKSYTVKFPLINTNSFQDVVQNWQLIWMLVYQNTPNRLTRDLIDPPCIYEANLDGTWYSKYAYISQLSVDFIGATRKMSIPLLNESAPSAGGASVTGDISIETIIPDAYEVTMTVVDIFGETRNMLYHSVNETNSKVSVETGLLDTSFSEIAQNVGDFARDTARDAVRSLF